MKQGFYLSRSLADKHKILNAMGIKEGSVEKRFNFSLKDEDDSTSPLDILITEPIGFWDTEKDYFARMLNHYKDASELNFFIATPGGFVDDMKTMVNFTAMHKAKKKVGYIMGDTASAGCVFANSLQEVHITPLSNFMHHQVWGGVMGNADVMEEYADELRKETKLIEDEIMKSARFKAKGKTRAELRDYMGLDKFLTAKEAVAWGFVDGIIEPSKIKLKNSAEVQEIAKKQSFLNVFLADESEMQSDEEPHIQEVILEQEIIPEKKLSLVDKLNSQFNQFKK